MSPATPVFELVYEAVRRIPAGCVTSYGQVGQAIGRPRAARIVGWALKALPAGSDVPWQRVINRTRRLSIVNMKVSAFEQKELLEREGRTVERRDDGWYVTGADWFEFTDGASGATAGSERSIPKQI